MNTMLPSKFLKNKIGGSKSVDCSTLPSSSRIIKSHRQTRNLVPALKAKWRAGLMDEFSGMNSDYGSRNGRDSVANGLFALSSEVTGNGRPSYMTEEPTISWRASDVPEWTEQSESDEGPDLLVEEAVSSSHGLFNDQFKAALRETLERGGKDALLGGLQQKEAEEHYISGQEEVLSSALIHAKHNVIRLQQVQDQIAKLLESETRQVERLEFAMTKARNDAAYYRTLSQMLEEKKREGM